MSELQRRGYRAGMCCVVRNSIVCKLKIDTNVFRSDNNTWEPINNIECHDLVNEFERSLKKKPKTKHSRRKLPPNSSTRDSLTNQSDYYASFQGLTAEAILGTTDAQGEVFHLVKWEGKDSLELVPALYTTLKFPHIVMAFYENRVSFITDNYN